MSLELKEIFRELGMSHYFNIFVDHGFDTWDITLSILESDL